MEGVIDYWNVRIAALPRWANGHFAADRHTSWQLADERWLSGKEDNPPPPRHFINNGFRVEHMLSSSTFAGIGHREFLDLLLHKTVAIDTVRLMGFNARQMTMMMMRAMFTVSPFWHFYQYVRFCRSKWVCFLAIEHQTVDYCDWCATGW